VHNLEKRFWGPEAQTLWLYLNGEYDDTLLEFMLAIVFLVSIEQKDRDANQQNTIRSLFMVDSIYIPKEIPILFPSNAWFLLVP
jgi:hypothetical protein